MAYLKTVRSGGEATTALFTVFDGHGEHGDRVSEFVMQYFRENLCRHELFATDVKMPRRRNAHRKKRPDGFVSARRTSLV